MKNIIALLVVLMAVTAQADGKCPTIAGGKISFELPNNARNVIFKKEANRSSIAFSLAKNEIIKWLDLCAPKREALAENDASIQEFEFTDGVMAILSPTKNGDICIEFMEYSSNGDTGGSAACKL